MTWYILLSQAHVNLLVIFVFLERLWQVKAITGIEGELRLRNVKKLSNRCTLLVLSQKS